MTKKKPEVVLKSIEYNIDGRIFVQHGDGKLSIRPGNNNRGKLEFHKSKPDTVIRFQKALDVFLKIPFISNKQLGK